MKSHDHRWPTDLSAPRSRQISIESQSRLLPQTRLFAAAQSPTRPMPTEAMLYSAYCNDDSRQNRPVAAALTFHFRFCHSPTSARSFVIEALGTVGFDVNSVAAAGPIARQTNNVSTARLASAAEAAADLQGHGQVGHGKRHFGGGPYDAAVVHGIKEAICCEAGVAG